MASRVSSSVHEPLSPRNQSATLLGPESTLQSSLSISSTTESYLSELLSYSLDRLKKEPDLLKQDRERIQRQIADTSVTHYNAYLAASHCLSSLQERLNRLNQTLNGCLEALPAFISSCEEFLEGSMASQSKWDDSKKLAANRERVLTLLEIPKLMETCVRQGHIDEALDLQLFVQRLGVLHGDLSAVQSLTGSLARVRELILSHLTAKLKSGIQLPECLSIVGHLRRLGIYSDRDLRLCFLRCREEWIDSLVAELNGNPPFDYLKKLVDIHRLHLFDIVMQFRAVFPSESANGDGGLLSEWALHRVTHFLDALRLKLPDIVDGASLLSLLESCMYCGMSLGRVGLDFRYLLISIFETRVLELFKAKLVEAVEVFSAQLDVHRWTEAPVRSPRAVESNGGFEEGSPPAELTRHLPLALFLNGFLSALNELRHCAPLRGKERVLGWTRQALEELASKLTRYASMRTLDPTQRPIFVSACGEFATVLCPYVGACLSRIYAHTQATLDVTPVLQHLQQIDGYV